MQATMPWRRWSFALVAVSVLGTLLAGSALILDGWIDALALYGACVLLLALMISRFGGSPMQPRFAVFAHGNRADSGAPTRLALTGAVGATLREAAPTD